MDTLSWNKPCGLADMILKKMFLCKNPGGLITVMILHFADFSVQMKQFDLFINCPLLLLFILQTEWRYSVNLTAKVCVALISNSQESTSVNCGPNASWYPNKTSFITNPAHQIHCYIRPLWVWISHRVMHPFKILFILFLLLPSILWEEHKQFS